MDDLKHEIARLTLRPGDIIVFMTPQILSYESRERLQFQLRTQFGDAHRVLVLEGGASISVLTREQIDALT